ncbi:hypothetical protein H4J63_07150 [Pseudoalteromonas sp. 5Ae-yellow]|uniref:hypothetical protein n=1 Tax=Pseudoalteromonas sp. 5Ae-yellow TaxID=2759847 RepID=UPI0015F548DD|nr:hypothetical protein [Pseudoalteromonas sp. 5Ae-yellow]MBA6409121.1 hypothetical protein [Pseudoalteromonas sp. 5Ae-yellow]
MLSISRFLISILVTAILLLIYYNYTPLTNPIVFISIAILSLVLCYSILNYFYSGEISKIHGVFAIVLFNFCLVAPALQFYYSYWYPYFYDSRESYNWLAATETWFIFSTIIILCFFGFKWLLVSKVKTKFNLIQRDINRKKLIFYSSFFLLISFFSQIFIYAKFGGVAGYISAYTLRGDGDSEFSGLGKFMIIGEAFPVLLAMTFAFFYMLKEDRKDGKQSYILLFLLSFLFLMLIFGGLKGSRSNTLLALFWLLSVINFYYKTITLKTLGLVGGLFIIYMMIYGVYKSAGEQFFNEVSYTNIQENSKYRGNALTGVLSGDLSRYEVQTEVINKVIFKNENTWLGESYLSAILTPTPKSFQKDLGVDNKTDLSTVLFFGRSNLDTNNAKSTLILGLVGESIANFHYVGVIFSIIYLIAVYLALIIIKSSVSPLDPRYILVFFFPIILTNAFTGDMQNLIFYIIKNLTVPIIFCYLVSEKRSES